MKTEKGELAWAGRWKVGRNHHCGDEALVRQRERCVLGPEGLILQAAGRPLFLTAGPTTQQCPWQWRPSQAVLREAQKVPKRPVLAAFRPPAFGGSHQVWPVHVQQGNWERDFLRPFQMVPPCPSAAR